MATVRVQREDFDPGAEADALALGRTDVGAVASFVGYCRDEGGGLAALDLEHYSGMAEEEIARAAGEAEARWPLLGMTVIHRYGRIAPGERIVFVAVAAAHRGAAFAAAEMLMDYLKTRAPFWKRAIGIDGAVEGWVEAKGDDDRSAARWSGAGGPSVSSP
jgi:molybdopterin synthase catalytic subunit